MCNSLEAAEYLTSIANKDFVPLNSFMVQNLLYVAQAHSLIKNGEPLFHEDFLAQEDGPYLPYVKTFYKFDGDFILIASLSVDDLIAKRHKKILEEIYNIYKEAYSDGYVVYDSGKALIKLREAIKACAAWINAFFNKNNKLIEKDEIKKSFQNRKNYFYA